MADEIDLQNVVRVERDPASSAWTATIGPDDGRAIAATHPSSPIEALCALVMHLYSAGYIFDPSWVGKAPDAP